MDICDIGHVISCDWTNPTYWTFTRAMDSFCWRADTCTASNISNILIFGARVRIRFVAEMHIEPLCAPKCKCISNILDLYVVVYVNVWHIEHIGHI